VTAAAEGNTGPIAKNPAMLGRIGGKMAAKWGDIDCYTVAPIATNVPDRCKCPSFLIKTRGICTHTGKSRKKEDLFVEKNKPKTRKAERPANCQWWR
jgi:hypothetical protein